MIPFAVLWLLSTILIAVARRTTARRRALLDAWYAGLRWPVILVVTLGGATFAPPTAVYEKQAESADDGSRASDGRHAMANRSAADRGV